MHHIIISSILKTSNVINDLSTVMKMLEGIIIFVHIFEKQYGNRNCEQKS